MFLLQFSFFFFIKVVLSCTRQTSCLEKNLVLSNELIKVELPP